MRVLAQLEMPAEAAVEASAGTEVVSAHTAAVVHIEVEPADTAPEAHTLAVVHTPVADIAHIALVERTPVVEAFHLLAQCANLEGSIYTLLPPEGSSTRAHAH